MHLFYVKDREGAHLLYKGGHNKICALKGTKGGTKEGTFVLHNTLYSILQELGEQLVQKNDIYSSMLSVQIYFHCMHITAETNYLK